jgi:hypothetical protein
MTKGEWTREWMYSYVGCMPVIRRSGTDGQRHVALNMVKAG